MLSRSHLRRSLALEYEGTYAAYRRKRRPSSTLPYNVFEMMIRKSSFHL
jgi:hypothetical protein